VIFCCCAIIQFQKKDKLLTTGFKRQPFRIEEQGWGEFEMAIVLHIAERGGEHTVAHDLNFAENEYVADHVLSFPTNKPNLARLLLESGPVPGLGGAPTPGLGTPNLNDLSNKRRGDEDLSKERKKAKVFEKGSVDLERLAEGLQKLGEDDLLGVVQMVTDNRTPEMFIKNDVDEGEFHMDLYTLPDRLLKSLWDYVKKRVDV
jgi:transcription initiation factor TFIID/TFIIF subunit